MKLSIGLLNISRNDLPFFVLSREFVVLTSECKNVTVYSHEMLLLRYHGMLCIQSMHSWLFHPIFGLACLYKQHH